MDIKFPTSPQIPNEPANDPNLLIWPRLPEGMRTASANTLQHVATHLDPSVATQVLRIGHALETLERAAGLVAEGVENAPSDAITRPPANDLETSVRSQWQAIAVFVIANRLDRIARCLGAKPPALSEESHAGLRSSIFELSNVATTPAPDGGRSG